MKAKELMLGVWVRTTNDSSWNEENRNRICKVTFLGNDYIVGIEKTSQKSLYGKESSFEPIPLTPEILMKNGFVYSDLPFIQGWQQFGLTLYRGGKGYLINCGENIAMVVNYVHQLQQALRLCGAEKEIIL